MHWLLQPEPLSPVPKQIAFRCRPLSAAIRSAIPVTAPGAQQAPAGNASRWTVRESIVRGGGLAACRRHCWIGASVASSSVVGGMVWLVNAAHPAPWRLGVEMECPVNPARLKPFRRLDGGRYVYPEAAMRSINVPLETTAPSR